MNGDGKETVEAARRSFETIFEEGTFYDRQTRDEAHLQKIMNAVTIDAGENVLDLGTGTGFLAFPLAMRASDAQIVGLDVAARTLCENRRRAEREGLANLSFVDYDGFVFPFAERSFDWVVTRYALHHFPQIQATFQEIERVLKPGGTLFLSDPAPAASDPERFIDCYMQMKRDGHVKFYTREEWQDLGRGAGLSCVGGFDSEIRFPKKRAAAAEFDAIVAEFGRAAAESYRPELTEDEIWVTLGVNNLLFRK